MAFYTCSLDHDDWVKDLSGLIHDCFVGWRSSRSLRKKYPSFSVYLAEVLYDELELADVVWNHDDDIIF